MLGLRGKILNIDKLIIQTSDKINILRIRCEGTGTYNSIDARGRPTARRVADTLPTDSSFGGKLQAEASPVSTGREKLNRKKYYFNS